MSCTKGQRNLPQQALELKLQHRGPEVFFRGLIEISNRCSKNCLYCGIRAGNSKVCRYEMSDEHVLREAQFALDAGYGSVAIQGGERSDSEFIEKITRLVWQIRHLQKGGNPESVMQLASEKASTLPLNNLGITLSLGEQPREVYREWKKAGATRYLLRHETFNEAHYRELHPSEMNRDHRLLCLEWLKIIGYQTGTGIMVGSPGQTIDHLVEDIRFIERFQPEMIGIGPFIPHADTPFGNEPAGSIEMTLKLISIFRLMHPSALIPSTTALATLSPDGRERGILAGANVVMPNLTPSAFRTKYAIYKDKASFGSEAVEGLQELERELNEIGYHIDYSRGDFQKYYDNE